jgi:hypothetical protein
MEPAGDAGSANCEQLCARHLGCSGDPNPSCLAQCELVLLLCPEQSQRLGRCLLAAEDAELECGPDDYTVPREGTCTSEQAQLESCVTGD